MQSVVWFDAVITEKILPFPPINASEGGRFFGLFIMRYKNLDEIFRDLKAGKVPDFLQVMRAIEEIGAYVLPPDQPKKCTLKRPGQRCKFCE